MKIEKFSIKIQLWLILIIGILELFRIWTNRDIIEFIFYYFILSLLVPFIISMRRTIKDYPICFHDYEDDLKDQRKCSDCKFIEYCI